MRCSNKIYQNELFKRNKIRTPKTNVYVKSIFKDNELDEVSFPVVIKQPDSAFSLGITKADNKEEMILALKRLFQKSDMIISQEFLYSEFDWRIGVLDNLPLFACKYYMTKGHWQIYIWNGDAEETSGHSETIPINEVPSHVLESALKAAALVGDGFYGVDLKDIDGKVYLIEVNDNPNVDVGVEDVVLKEKLYEMIIDSIYKRIEISRNIKRYVSN